MIITTRRIVIIVACIKYHFTPWLKVSKFSHWTSYHSQCAVYIIRHVKRRGLGNGFGLFLVQTSLFGRQSWLRASRWWAQHNVLICSTVMIWGLVCLRLVFTSIIISMEIVCTCLCEMHKIKLSPVSVMPYTSTRVQCSIGHWHLHWYYYFPWRLFAFSLMKSTRYACSI